MLMQMYHSRGCVSGSLRLCPSPEASRARSALLGDILRFKTGSRHRSQVGTTELIVIACPDNDFDLLCGGHPIVELGALREQFEADPGLNDVTPIGKRFISEAIGLEILITKEGSGTFSVDDVPLIQKEAKPLPSSD
jgi:hypothetical protein